MGNDGARSDLQEYYAIDGGCSAKSDCDGRDCQRNDNNRWRLLDSGHLQHQPSETDHHQPQSEFSDSGWSCVYADNQRRELALGAKVSWGTTSLTTSFVSASKVTAAGQPSLIAQPGSASITVTTSGGTSAAAAFTIYPEPAAATPTFSPAAGTYTVVQSLPVAIADATAGATIYFTTDGSAPTTSSSKYASAISLNSAKTIEAIAVAQGFATSAVATPPTPSLRRSQLPRFPPAPGLITLPKP